VIGTFLLVVVLHGLWDSRGGLPWYAVLSAVSLGLLWLEVRHLPTARDLPPALA
jgi:hypothetical protein